MISTKVLSRHFMHAMTKTETLVRKAVQALTKYFVEKGVKGVYVNGSSGECIYQSVEDRKIVLENVMKAAEGKADSYRTCCMQ